MRGEVVLVTGGSSGIGLAAARRFAQRGAKVWIVARDEVKLHAAAESIEGDVGTLSADVSDPGSLLALARTVEERDGRIDILVNSAGQLELGDAAASAADIAERLMRVNYLGLTRVVAATLPLVRAGRRRSIVNLSSFVGRLAPPYWSAYAASKHAVQAYSNALRQELKPEKIHVGIVMPGPVRSPMTQDLLGTPMYPIPFGVPVIEADRVADAILACAFRRKAELAVPHHFGPLLRLGAAFPRLVDLLYLPYRRR